jgi:hypothetical protein
VATRKTFCWVCWPTGRLLQWRFRLDRMGACGWSGASTRRWRLQPASSVRRMGSAGRHQARRRGWWPAALAHHPWRVASGTAAATALLAGAVLIFLPGRSPRPSVGGCGLVSCAGTRQPSRATASQRGSQPARTLNPGVSPSPKPQPGSATAPPAQTSARPSRTPTRGPRPGHTHPTHPSPSHPGKPTTATPASSRTK